MSIYIVSLSNRAKEIKELNNAFREITKALKRLNLNKSIIRNKYTRFKLNTLDNYNQKYHKTIIRNNLPQRIRTNEKPES